MPKTKETFTRLLGLNQLDLAMLLGVNKSQLAMYETGKRSLPLHAMQLLAELTTQVIAPATKAKNKRPEAFRASPEYIEYLIQENGYQRLITERKLAVAVKKEEQRLRLQELAQFLNSREASKKGAAGHEAITLKASKMGEAKFSDARFELEHKLRVLDYEKSLLDAEVRAFQTC